MSENTSHTFIEQTPKFLRNDPKQFRLLQRRVNQAIGDQNKGLGWVKFKVIVFPLLYVSIFVGTLLSFDNRPLFYFGYFTLGILLVIIFLTVIHELSHDNVFKNKKLNRILLYFFDIMGANSFIWKKRHQLMHHNYPNIKGWDTDIEQSNMFKIFPDDPTTGFHKHQHRFVFLFYPFYLLNWLLVRDFRDFFGKNRIIKKAISIPAIEYIKLLAFKIFYFSYILVIPHWLFNIPILNLLFGFVILTFTASILALSVLLPPHAAVQNEFPSLLEDNQIKDTWLSHQLKTTSDITNHNWFIHFFMGNFNFHVMHHLLPNLSYIHMEKATEALMAFAREEQLPYKRLGLRQALINHYKLLKANAVHDNLFEETF